MKKIILTLFVLTAIILSACTIKTQESPKVHNPNGPAISFLDPISGPINTPVTITGSGFTNNANNINFNSGDFQGVIPNIGSHDGKAISFRVPSEINPACYYQAPPCELPTRQVVPGNYFVSVSNANGISNKVSFTVKSSNSPAICDYPSPPPGCNYIRGHDYNPTTNCGLVLSCDAKPLSITTSSPLPNGQIGSAYSISIQASGGSGDYDNWKISSGSLPPGLSFTGSSFACFAFPCPREAAIRGTPTVAGTYTFTIEVGSNPKGDGPTLVASKQFTLNVDSDEIPKPKSINLTGDIQNSHDPVIIEVGGTFFSFSTGPNIQIKTSSDLLNWKLAGQLFDGSPPRPDWLSKKVPGVTDLWAPDVSYFGGSYHIYYAANGGQSRPANCIGHATAVNFNFGDFVDRGPVICTNDDGIIDDDWSAIDPNVIIDEKGKPWLALGSFGSGIKMIELDQTGARANDKLYSIASRAQHNSDAAIEAPFIVRRGSYYYLFASWGYCCRGVNSTYNIRVGRSNNVFGPYLDKSGKAMMDGGGTLVLEGNNRWRGPGHNAILFVGKLAYNVYHSYDAESKGHDGVAGVPTLRISELVWDDDGWPVSGGP